MLPNVWLRTPPSFLFPFLEGSAKRSQLPVSGTKSQFYSPRVLQSYRVLYRPVVGIGICIRIRAPFVATTVERTLEIELLLLHDIGIKKCKTYNIIIHLFYHVNNYFPFLKSCTTLSYCTCHVLTL